MSNESFLFSGSSHSQGIALVIELSKKYNSVDWLQKHGVHTPLKFADNEIEHQLERENRWSYLLCERFGVNELNIREHPKYGDDGNDTLYRILNKKIKLDDSITNVFLEATFTRWTREDGEIFTPSELIDYLEKTNSKSDRESIDIFLQELENSTSVKKYINSLNLVKKMYPKVKFWHIWFHNQNIGNDINLRPEGSLNNIFIDEEYYNNGFLEYFKNKKQLIYQVSNCYKNPQWEVSYNDNHIGSQGQRDLSNLIYDYITNETRLREYII